MLSGAVCFDKSWSPQDTAHRIAAASSKFGLTTPRVLYESEKICIHSIERTHDNFCISRLTPPTGGIEWILADIGYAPDCQKLFAGACTSAPAILRSLPGRWLSVFIEQQLDTIRITNDDLGLAWLFIGRLPGGYVFSSDFGAIARNLSKKPTINQDALLAELAVGRSFNDSTIAAEITVAPPGCSIDLEPNGLKIHRRHRYRYGDQFSGLTQQDKFRMLDGIYERIVKDYVSGFGPQAVLSLSGGYDSRTALACIHRHGMRPPLFTFGTSAGNEVREARDIAGTVGSTTTVFEISDTDWHDWQSRVEALGTSGMLQFSGWCQQWLSLIRTKGNAVVIGYLGDTITGKKIAKCERYAERVGWAEAWTNWELAQKASVLLRPEKKALIQELVHEYSKEEFSGVDCAYSFQKVLHGDLYGRQARRVASQPNVISRFVTPILFFYDSELIDFWCNLPFDDLYQQELYYAYGTSRFPDLFPPKHGQSSRTSWLTRAARFADGIFHRRNRPRKTGVIDHWSIINCHKEDILAPSKVTAAILDAYIDVDALVRYVNGDNHPRIEPAEAVQTINLMILANTLL